MNCRHRQVSGRIAQVTGNGGGSLGRLISHTSPQAPLDRARLALTADFHQSIENVWRRRLSIE
jgi:hypothetical protein